MPVAYEALVGLTDVAGDVIGEEASSPGPHIGRGYGVRCVVLPNGSRLSCGANSGGRKRPALRYELAGAQTYASSESWPRQLQALVRPLHRGLNECRDIFDRQHQACALCTTPGPSRLVVVG